MKHEYDDSAAVDRLGRLIGNMAGDVKELLWWVSIAIGVLVVLNLLRALLALTEERWWALGWHVTVGTTLLLPLNNVRKRRRWYEDFRFTIGGRP